MKEFESCDKCQHSGKGLTEYPCNTCVHNAIDHYKPMTNADAIRNMTDEELADFLNCIHEQDEDTILIPNGNKYEAYHSDDEILEWLQSKVEGVTENE